MHPDMLNLVNQIFYNDVNITTNLQTTLVNTNGFNLIHNHFPHFKAPITWLSIESNDLRFSEFNVLHVHELGRIINDFQSVTEIDSNNDILILTQFNVSLFFDLYV